MRSIVNRPLSDFVPNGRLLVATAATALVASLALALSTPATVSVDGQRLASDVAPVTTPDGAYLPLRAVSDAAGARTTYDPQTGQITVRRGSEVLAMHVGTTLANLDGHRITLARAPFAVRGRVLVSSATIARAFGSSVRYDARHDRVVVRTPGVVVAGAADDEP
jgi:phage baseplate assembly protein gpV